MSTPDALCASFRVTLPHPVRPLLFLAAGGGKLCCTLPWRKAVSLRHTHPHPPASFPGGPGHSLKPNSCLGQEFLVKEPAEEEVQAGEEWRGVVGDWNGPEHQGRRSLAHEPLGMPRRRGSPLLCEGSGSLNRSPCPSCNPPPHPPPATSSHLILCDLPAQSQRGQEQHHKDEEGVTLVHGGPVLPRAGAGGAGAEVSRSSPHAHTPSLDGITGGSAGMGASQGEGHPSPAALGPPRVGRRKGKGLPSGAGDAPGGPECNVCEVSHRVQ